MLIDKNSYYSVATAKGDFSIVALVENLFMTKLGLYFTSPSIPSPGGRPVPLPAGGRLGVR